MTVLLRHDLTVNGSVIFINGRRSEGEVKGTEGKTWEEKEADQKENGKVGK